MSAVAGLNIVCEGKAHVKYMFMCVCVCVCVRKRDLVCVVTIAVTHLYFHTETRCATEEL